MSLYTFLFKNKRKRFSLATYALTAWYRATILLVPAKVLQKHWGISGEESTYDLTDSQYRYAMFVSRRVNSISSKTKWESKCLVRALTARKFLLRKGIPNTLYLGVGNDGGKMVAHAWLRAGHMYVTGGDGEGYANVAKFASE